MKHLQVIELKKSLLAIKGLKSVEVNYAILENLERIETALKPIAEQEKKIEEQIKDFVDERTEAGKKLATVNGEAKTKQQVTENGIAVVFDIPDDKMEDFTKQVNELRTKHAEVIKQYETERSDFLKFLETGDSPLELYTVKLAHVPTDISTETLKAIFPFVRKKVTAE